MQDMTGEILQLTTKNLERYQEGPIRKAEIENAASKCFELINNISTQSDRSDISADVHGMYGLFKLAQPCCTVACG